MVKVIVGAELSRVADWYARAINSDIAGYLSTSLHWAYPTEASGNWDNTFLMTDNNLGLAMVYPDRQSSNQTVTVSLWVLGSSWQQRYTAARLGEHALRACSAYGANYLELTCHASNAPSLALCERLCGTPISRRVEAAWNSTLGTWEDSILFRAKLSDVRQRVKLKRT